MSVEADLLKEYETFQVFDNCILQLEEVRNTVRAIPPGEGRKAKLNCPSGSCFAHNAFKTLAPMVVAESLKT